ncbi:hypothetical protein PsYK624_157970 [Phanerochaete sordida]|uniref:F-box domain-containing protein n=1 Tax=Phanerochaete sordida TaxID=48140 RepID=A0A9P3GPW0_9APHY|nr:hypothetical protein PsYK624_157970 [Phanerochaete sordida]
MLLPFDTLTEVMDLLERPDASVMSRTCRTLHHTCPRILLRGTVTIWSEVELLSLHTFLSVDQRRCGFLRSLALVVEVDDDAESLELVTSLLSDSKQLVQLDLPRWIVLGLDESLLHAESFLPGLRVLGLDGTPDEIDAFLEGLRTPLESITARFWPETYPNEVPINALRDMKDTLETVNIYCGARLDTAEAPAPVVFPLVTKLTLRIPTHGDLKVIEDHFPNLQRLVIRGPGIYRPTDMSTRFHRDLNIHRDSNQPWKSMEFLRGDLRDLYALGVICKVEHLEVDSRDYLHGDEYEYELLEQVLYSTCPTTLLLPHYVDRLASLRLSNLIALARDSLRSLRLVLRMPEFRFHTDPFIELRSLCEELSGHALEHLQIKFEEFLVPSDAADDYIDLNIAKLADCAFHGLTLRTFCIESRDTPWAYPKIFVRHSGADGKSYPHAYRQLPWDARAMEILEASPFELEDE